MKTQWWFVAFSVFQMELACESGAYGSLMFCKKCPRWLQNLLKPGFHSQPHTPYSHMPEKGFTHSKPPRMIHHSLSAIQNLHHPQNLHFEEKYPPRTYLQRREASQVHFFRVNFCFLDIFLDNFWPQTGPQNGSKFGPKNNKNRVHFQTHSLWGLGALQVPLESILAPPKLFWMAFEFQSLKSLKAS